MCTLKLPPAARLAAVHDSDCDGLEPVIEQDAPTGGPSIVQVTPDPDPAGSASLTATPVAVPAPVLDTVIVNPIGSPAFTDGESAFLRMLIEAAATVSTSVEQSLTADAL